MPTLEEKGWIARLYAAYSTRRCSAWRGREACATQKALQELWLFATHEVFAAASQRGRDEIIANIKKKQCRLIRESCFDPPLAATTTMQRCQVIALFSIVSDGICFAPSPHGRQRGRVDASTELRWPLAALRTHFPPAQAAAARAARRTLLSAPRAIPPAPGTRARAQAQATMSSKHSSQDKVQIVILNEPNNRKGHSVKRIQNVRCCQVPAFCCGACLLCSRPP